MATIGIIMEISGERCRQQVEEGYSPEYDDGHARGEIAQAAAAYALVGTEGAGRSWSLDLPKWLWPWSRDSFKPYSRRQNLIRAAALIVAEIERLDREAAK